MNLRNIDYILEIAASDSLIHAAERLHVSQPCLSQLIKHVEKQYSTELFVRHSKPLRLTYAGEKFIAAISQIRYLERNLCRTMENISKGKKGRIHLGIPLLRAQAFLPELLAAYRKDYPDIEVQIHEAGSVTLEKMLREGKIDIAFASIGNFDTAIQYTKICSERIYIIAGKNTALAQKLSSGNTIDITEAKDEQFIYVKKGHGIRDIQEALFSAHNMAPPLFFETASIELAKKLALVCDKVTLYPEIIRTKLNIQPEGCFYPIHEAQHLRNFCLCYRKDFALTAYMQAFILCSCKILQEEAEDHP